ncbi:MAG: hypothetical protein PHT60_10685 [Acidiphilium sp.]|nr:hypothetical protein [Acidiphilium sp.]MDD4936226.1 hypothetical protein [Acidiphilium sp.]
MRKFILAAPFAALALAGCAIGPSLAEQMSGYVGRPESVLVAQLGVPDRRIQVGDLTYFAYVHRSVQFDSGSFGYGPFYGPAFGGYYGPFYGGGFPAQTYTTECTTTFALKDQVVQSFTLRGNDC